MRRAISCLSIAALTLVMFSTSFLMVQGTDDEEDHVSSAVFPVKEALGSETVQQGFIRNAGQWDHEVIFALKGDRMISYFTSSGVSHDLKMVMGGHVIFVGFEHTSNIPPVGVNILDHKVNFFIGNNPEKWASDVECYEKLLYEDVWPGIDILYYTLDHDLKYDVILDEFASPEDVKFTVKGAMGISINGDALEMELSDSISLWDMDLTAFYEDGEEAVIGFRKIDSYSYGFDVDKEPGRAMVIDPVLFSTAIGGSGLDSVYDMEVDETGNYFISGNTMSVDFPNTTGAYDNYPGNPPGDVFVSKFNRNGSSLIFSSFLGGWTFDCAGGMDIDRNGSIYLAGWTYGWEFPTTPGAFMEKFRGPSDFYVTKFAANGSSLEYSTLVCSESIDIGYDVAVLDGQACVVGHTLGKQFPSPFGYMGGVHGLGIVFMMSRNGSTMIDFAGIDGYYGEHLTKIVMNHDREFVITGHTSSPDIPTTSHSVQLPFHPGYSNTFLVKYIPFRGAFDFISNLGRLTVHGLKVDRENDIFITGMVMQDGVVSYPGTEDAIFNQVNGTRDAFILEIAHNGSRIIRSCLIGGPLRDEGGDIEFDDAGNIYLVGQTTDLSNLTDLGGRPPGNRDGFIMKLDSNLSRILNLTYIGASDEDALWYCRIYENNDLLVCGMEISTDMYFQNNFNLSDMCSIFTMRVSVQSSPSSPLCLEVMESDARIDLTWLPPIDDGKSMITNYSIYRGPSPDNMTLFTSIGNETRFSDPDAELGRTYYYAVAAVNTFGEGSLSDIEGNISTTLPSPPTDFEIELPIGAASISFGPPISDGGTSIIKYSVYRDGKHLDDIPFNVHHYVDVDLGNGVYHKYSLTSWNRNGESEQTESIIIRTKDYPGAPRALMCERGAGYIQLRWREPDYTGGLDIECYHVYRGLEPGNLTLYRIVPFDTVSFRDTRIYLETEYFYQVLTLNELGLSSPSDTVSGIFMGLPQPPVHLSAEGAWNSIDLSWSRDPNTAGEPVGCYKVYHGYTSDTMVLLDIIEGNSTSYTHSGLTKNRLHYYRLTSVTELGESNPSMIVQQRPVIAPSPPTDLRTSHLPGSVVLEWSPPSSNGNSPIAGYVLFKGNESGELQVLITTTGSSTEFLDQEIERGQRYRYAVRSMNGFGVSPISETVVSWGMFIPDPPSNTLVSLNNGSVRISWDAPIYDGGSNITHYSVIRVDPSGQEVLSGSVGPATFSITDDSVLKGRVYTYYVIAINIMGSSDPGKRVTLTIENVPGTPVELGAMIMGEFVILTWSPPVGYNGSGITDYFIYRKGSDLSPQKIGQVSGDRNIFVDRDVESGEDYEYWISAQSVVGEGKPTIPITVVVEKDIKEGTGSEDVMILLAIVGAFILIILMLFNLVGWIRDQNGGLQGGEE
ncbi:MAG: fibronectin type III domain-containing protein [Thermoplasmatota archaeon]